MGVVFLLAPQIWIAGFRIVLQSDKILYFRWFIVKQEILKKDIAKVGITTGRSSKNGGGFYTLVLTAPHKKQPSVAINIKPFSRKALKAVAREILASSPNAEIETTIYRLAEGDVSSISKAGIRIFMASLPLLFLTLLIIASLRAFFHQ